MRKPWVRLALTLSLLLEGCLSAHAYFTRLFTSSLKPKDNLEECSQQVRDQLQAIDHKKWGKDIHFDCADGVVHSLFVPSDSPIPNKLIEFVASYPRLFDEQGAAVVDGGAPFLRMALKRSELFFYSGYVDKGLRPAGDPKGMYFIDFNSNVEPPASWSSTPKISSDKAEEAAMARAEQKRKHHLSLTKSSLVFAACAGQGKTKAELVWRVDLREAGNPQGVVCYVSASTGKLCEYWDCISSDDPWEL